MKLRWIHFTTAFVAVLACCAAQTARAQQQILYLGDQNNGNLLRYTTSGTQLSNLTNIGAGDEPEFAPDPFGNVYVVNYATSQIVKFSSIGVNLGNFAPFVHAATGVYADSSGNVFVSDWNYNNDTALITKYSPTGSKLLQFTVNTSGGQATSIATDAAGNIYLTNQTSSISKYAPSGVFLNSIGSGFTIPEGLTFNSSGNLYVTSYNTTSVREFAPNGTELTPFLSGIPDSWAEGIVFDAAGDAFVDGDGDGGNFHEYNAAGTLIGTYSQPGGGVRDIAIGPDVLSGTPEPGTLALLTSGAIAAVGVTARRKRNRNRVDGGCKL